MAWWKVTGTHFELPYTERAEQNFCKTHINYIKNIALTGFTLALAIFSAEPSLARDNRTDVRAEISEGWAVAWGKHIDHWEYGKLSACMFDPTLVCVQSYFTNLLESSVQDIGKEVVLQALKNRGETFGAGQFEIQAGIATYNHWHMENPCSLNPFNGDCWQKFPEPNTHQPYLRWRRVRGSNSLRGREFYLKNNCSEPVELLLRYRNPSGNWVTRGWWSFDSGKGAFLSSSGERIRSDNSIFYYYAQIPGTSYSWSGSEEREFRGREYPTRKRKISPDSDGDWYLPLSCSNYEP